MVGEAMRKRRRDGQRRLRMAQFVAAGQYDISASSYHSNAVDLKAEGPVDWEPPVVPLIVLPFVAGLNAEGAVSGRSGAVMDFFLTDAQSIMVEHGRQPANLTVEGGTLAPEYEIEAIDLETMVDEQERWEGRVQRLRPAVRSAASVFVYWRRRLNASERPHRIDEAVKEVAAQTGVLHGRARRALDSTVLDDAVATQDTVI